MDEINEQAVWSRVLERKPESEIPDPLMPGLSEAIQGLRETGGLYRSLSRGRTEFTSMLTRNSRQLRLLSGLYMLGAGKRPEKSGGSRSGKSGESTLCTLLRMEEENARRLRKLTARAGDCQREVLLWARNLSLENYRELLSILTGGR